MEELNIVKNDRSYLDLESEIDSNQIEPSSIDLRENQWYTTQKSIVNY